MRGLRRLRHLVRLVRLVGRLLHWLELDTRRGRLDWLQNTSFVLALHDYSLPNHGHALGFFLLYLYCITRATPPPTSA